MNTFGQALSFHTYTSIGIIIMDVQLISKMSRSKKKIKFKAKEFTNLLQSTIS